MTETSIQKLASLPIYSHLDEICQALKNSPSHFLVLTAETAAGKSTAVPTAILDKSELFPKKIYMLEPRRLAVISIAERISWILGEKSGEKCGYRVQLEQKIGKETRLEILTEAILTRFLQADPLLEDASVVILDEFHERSIHSDLALAFLKEAVEVREDLYVIVMSATMEVKSLCAYLGSENKPCANLRIEGRKFPVEIEYRSSDMVSSILRETKLIDCGKTVLAFFPGLREINKAYSDLTLELGTPSVSSSGKVEILRLHSSLSLEEQKRVLSEVPKDVKRIVLSSAIAETSLTVPGVYTVVDSGLSRLNRLNVRLGMEELVTEAESLFSAEQRAGRAGRLGNGKCIRLWEKNEVRPVSTTPEIRRTDISSLVLECSLRNIKSPSDLEWLEPPSPSAWSGAVSLLEILGCLKNASITEKGKQVLKLGLSPRLSCVALFGDFETVLKYSSYAKASPEMQKRFLENLKSRVEKLPPPRKSDCEGGKISSDAKGSEEKLSEAKNNCADGKADGANSLLEGFPDRLAHFTGNAGLYQFPSGRVSSLLKNDIQKMSVFPEWIIAPEVDAGETQALIYSWEAVDASFAENWLRENEKITVRTEVYFEESGSGGKNTSGSPRIRKDEVLCFGKIVLSRKKLPVSDEDFGEALCSEIRKKGLEVLPLSEEARLLIVRKAFWEQQKASEKSDDFSVDGKASEREEKSSAGGTTFVGNEKTSAGGTASGKETRKSSENAIKNDGENEKVLSGVEKITRKLEETPEEWLMPFLGGMKGSGMNKNVSPQNVYQSLYWILDGATLDAEVPVFIGLENGKRRKISYQTQILGGSRIPVIRPVLEIIIQQIFGCFETPKVLGMPVLLKLLSPARRPLQITDNLSAFWTNTWPEICKEMKGRYPKHNWDYRVSEPE